MNALVALIVVVSVSLKGYNVSTETETLFPMKRKRNELRGHTRQGERVPNDVLMR